MTETTPPPDTNTTPPAQDRRMGRDIAFGIQQTLACWATDFIDPYVSKWFQNKYGNKQHQVTAAHTWGGEIVGDSAAFFAYMFIKRIFTKPVDAVINTVRHIAHPLLNRFGHKAIAPWAADHHVSEDDPRYQKKLEEYEAFQAENLVDSTIIATAATGINVGAQRWMFDNKQGLGIILASKLIGAAATMSTMLGLRTALPTTMRHLDDELSDRYFSKVVRGIQGIFGVKNTATPVMALHHATVNTHDSLSPEKREGLLALVAEHTSKIDMNDPAQFAKLVAKQKSVYRALETAFAENGYLVNVMAREHYEVIEKHYRQYFSHQHPGSRMNDKEASRMNVLEEAAANRRDLRQFMALLDDANFINEVKHVVASGTVPARKNAAISSEEKKRLSASLLEPSAETTHPIHAIFDKAEARTVECQAMAHAMRPDGVAARVLADTLKKSLPDYDVRDLEGIAKDYMGYYQKEALVLAAEFTSESTTVRSAVERAMNLRKKYPATSRETSLTMAL